MTHWIAGEWLDGHGEAINSTSPYNNEVIWQGQSASPEQVESAVSAARNAFVSWKNAAIQNVNQSCLLLLRK